ncbi:membrane protein insertase YidC [uncultured Erythrobacter sp.]|uniref:membrane protein insertase YidC n=1 Tax=uncultured Erythrobacter sp. TaxID=263913 RepID=UPI002608D15E|nr:membrane protein insertase YidC [uncultured Erythrobacter sp.]
MDNQRNLLLAVLLSGLLLLGWDVGMRYFYPAPPESEVAETTAATADSPDGATSGTSTSDLGEAAAAEGPVDLATALADPNRVIIDAPRVAGSINLVGARIDDIVLKDYNETTEDGSDPVRLFAPERSEFEHFAEFGFVVGGERMSSRAIWQADGERLTADNPVTLSRTDENGITYRIRLSIDDQYMIAAEQSVENTSENAAIVQPFAYVKRTDINATPGIFIAHTGPTGVFDGTLYDPNYYEDLAEIERDTPAGEASWLGFTDNYWFSALIPGEGETDTVGWRSLGDNLFRADLIYDSVTVPAGGTVTQSTQLFAGAKESVVLDQYEETGITYFGKAISWGWFEWFEKPLLWLLRWLNGLVGNFGVAIILLTVIIRGLMFPIAQKQFSSMAAMKAVQPKMKAIQERYKDDKQQQQQKIMELYKEEKVNPLAGCLPLIIQIPIFFALYKVLYLAIEMRHEEFLYISDLSGPDPANLANLLSLIGINVPGFLMIIFGIGVFAVLLGVTMWLTFKLNPSAMDPMQQQIFNLMPWILMFVMAGFASGLLIYWVTSNILTLAQQTYLYSRHPQLRAAAEKEKAEKAKQKAREDAEKSGT